MKALIFKNEVIQIEDKEFPVASDLFWKEVDDNVQVGWLYENDEFKPKPIPQKTNEEIQKEYAQAMQAHIDQTARTKDYDDGYACATYVNSTNDVWKQEALDFIAWRDSVWSYAYNVQQQDTIPDLEDFIDNAPKIGW